MGEEEEKGGLASKSHEIEIKEWNCSEARLYPKLASC